MNPPSSPIRVVPFLAVLAGVAVLGALGAAVFIYSGAYDIAADKPHTKPVFWAISQLRDRSIAVRAKGIAAPADLDSPERVSAGAQIYGGVCKTCHLAPGMAKTDVAAGLYPRPPQLAYGDTLSPGQQFWIIKHGLKLTGMPAWGRSYSDAEVWDLVAFVRKLPQLSPEQYHAAVKGEPMPAAAPAQ